MQVAPQGGFIVRMGMLFQRGKAAKRECGFSRYNAFPNGEGKEEAASPQKKKANPASLRSAAPSKGRGSRGHSLLPMEGGAPKGRRLDGDSGMKESEERSSQVDDIREHPIHRCAVPLPQWGRLRYEDTAFLDTTPFQRGKAKRKPTPPRCARQPLPREGARVDAPSLLWGRLRNENTAISFLPSFLDLSILFSCRLRS